MFGFTNKENLSDYTFTVKNAYAINYSGYYMKPHIHDDLEIIYCENGTFDVICYKDDSKFIHNLKSNQCIVVYPNVPHAILIKEGVKARLLNVKLGIAPINNIKTSAILNENKDFTSIYFNNTSFFTVYDDKNIITDINEILAETSPSRNTSSEFLEVLATKLLLDLARNYFLYNSSDVYHVQKALEFIENNFSLDIAVSDISNAVKLHQSYLQKQIKKITGKSIVEHINTFRTERAKILIEYTNSSLTNISVQCGYCNRQTFYNAFKKYVGVNPREYKNRIIEKRLTQMYQKKSKTNQQ